MNHVKSALLLIFCFCLSAVASAEEKLNLLNNGNFTTLDEKGKPTHWEIYSSGNKVSIDKTDKPEGIGQSVKVSVTETENSLGSLVQKIKGLPKNTKLVLSAKMKSTHDEAGIMQIKLRNDGKETDRINSEWAGKEWKEIKVEFNTGESDEIRIQCRFNQNEKAKGAEVWFADLKLVQAE
ncbi:MAG: carbohydrate binding domain-containing protein [Planctomycetes bacterium]|nr:carbohydrate binding domain-containing protein [Planctomycetota bacterium]